MAENKPTSPKSRRSGASAADKPSAAALEFHAIAESLCRTDKIERVKLFGFDCLRASGKVFAKLHKGQLVIRLPADRIGALMSTGALAPYERGQSCMKQWAVAQSADKKRLEALLRESLKFVRN